MKGILLAGGKGTRLWPLTCATSKQLLPIYDKPMIYYPLSVLLLAGIKDILLICNPEDEVLFQKLLGNGSSLGVHIEYAIQTEPRGIADAFLIGEKFIGNSPVCLMLGDNFFYGDNLPMHLRKAAELQKGALVFAYHVNSPEQYGVVSFDENGKATKLVEKPKTFISSYAVPGLYFYDARVVDWAKELSPSDRGELEITDINKRYLSNEELKVEVLGRGMAWLDTGTPDNLFRAGEYVRVIEQRQGWKVACLEEISFRMGNISEADLINLSQKHPSSDYQKYLQKLLEKKGI